MTSDAVIWADLSQRIAAAAEIIGREPDGADVSDRITDTAEALGVDRERVRQVYVERTVCGIGG